jgi:hypothetical protein
MSTQPTVLIEVSPSARNPSRFVARETVGGRVLGTFSAPLCGSARVLLAEGLAPDTAIEMRHSGSKTIALRTKLGVAASLTIVEETSTGVRRFAQWKPYAPAEQAQEAAAWSAQPPLPSAREARAGAFAGGAPVLPKGCDIARDMRRSGWPIEWHMPRDLLPDYGAWRQAIESIGDRASPGTTRPVSGRHHRVDVTGQNPHQQPGHALAIVPRHARAGPANHTHPLDGPLPTAAGATARRGTSREVDLVIGGAISSKDHSCRLPQQEAAA